MLFSSADNFFNPVVELLVNALKVLHSLSLYFKALGRWEDPAQNADSLVLLQVFQVVFLQEHLYRSCSIVNIHRVVLFRDNSAYHPDTYIISRVDCIDILRNCRCSSLLVWHVFKLAVNCFNPFRPCMGFKYCRNKTCSMDILGKQAEEALEGVQNVSRRLEKLESHLNALDSALQDTRNVVQEDYRVEEAEAATIEDINQRASEDEVWIEELEQRLDVLEAHQEELDRELREIVDRKLLVTLRKVSETIDRLNTSQNRLRSDFSDLQEEVDRLENEWLLEANRREYDFERKLDSEEFESEKTDMWDEIRKLRSSVNILAEELDKKEDIEVE